MRIIAIVVIGMVLAGGAAWGDNLLANGSFEKGEKRPAGWGCFGVGGQGWEVGAPEGQRYVSVAGDGTDESGWYATTGKRQAQSNRVYRVSFWVRKEADTLGGEVKAGLTRAKWQFPASREWERKVFHFRSADLISGLRFELGQHEVEGAVDFDDVGLYPSVAVHRSRGRGRYLLGDGENVIERRYTASIDPASPHANDYRFLYRASADYDGDRWVLDKTDMIVYVHQIEIAGALQPDPKVRGTITVSTSETHTGGPNTGWTDITEIKLKGDDSHLVEQEAVTVELDVPKCNGSILVEMAPGPNGPWSPAKAIDSAGTYAIAAPKMLLIPSRTIAVRITSLTAKRIEITGYRFHSMLIQQEARQPVYGDTHYVDILQDSPTLECGLVDMGDLRTNGRDEVSLKIANKGARRLLVMAVTVKRGSELISREERQFALGVNAETMRAVPYRVAPEGDQALMVTLRDAKTSELLLDLESLFSGASE